MIRLLNVIKRHFIIELHDFVIIIIDSIVKCLQEINEIKELLDD